MPSRPPHRVHRVRTIAGGPQICARCGFVLSAIVTATGHELVWTDGEEVGVAMDGERVEAAWPVGDRRLLPFEQPCQ